MYKVEDFQETFMWGRCIPIYPPNCFKYQIIKKHINQLMCQDDILWTIAIKKDCKVISFLTRKKFYKFSHTYEIDETQESALCRTINSPTNGNGNLKALEYCIKNKLLTLKTNIYKNV